MSEVRHGTFASTDNRTTLHYVEWIPDGQIKGILQISHGMQEYIERYAEFAEYMNRLGFLVVGNDHIGHGASIRSEKEFGFFAEKNGNKVLLSDLRMLQRKMQQKYPGIPYVLLGHSMGSFLARQYLCMYGKHLDAAVICGTGWHSGLEAKTGMLLCRILAACRGWHYRSALVEKIAMGSYNKSFEPGRTPKDWLSRNEESVDAYIADKRTQFRFTLNGFYNLFYSLNYLSDPKNLRRMPKNLPVLFIAGERDPVGNFGVGVKKAVVSFQNTGMRYVSCSIYPNDRHEILNELDRKEIYKDVGNWVLKAAGIR